MERNYTGQERAGCSAAYAEASGEYFNIDPTLIRLAFSAVRMYGRRDTGLYHRGDHHTG